MFKMRKNFYFFKLRLTAAASLGGLIINLIRHSPEQNTSLPNVSRSSRDCFSFFFKSRLHWNGINQVTRFLTSFSIRLFPSSVQFKIAFRGQQTILKAFDSMFVIFSFLSIPSGSSNKLCHICPRRYIATVQDV